MKLKTLSIILFLAVFSFSCEKFEWDLPRDNPLAQNIDANSDEDPDLLFSKFEVIYENNFDGKVNKGETVYLKVYIKNEGGSAVGVDVNFSTTSTYVSSITPNQRDYGDISPNAEVTPESYSYYNYDGNGYYTFKFTVSNSTPVGEKLTFNMNISDTEGNSWTDNFEVTVVSTNAEINYSKYEIVYENNNDGKINKGETVYLKLFVKNNGTSTANGVDISFTTTSSYVSSITPNKRDYGDVSPNAESTPETYSYYNDDGNDYYTFKFIVSNSTPAGEKLIFNMSISDSEGNNWTDSFEVTVVSTDAEIDFSKYEIVYENNNDGKINKGETVYLKLFVKNNGTSMVNDIDISFTSTSTFVSSITPSQRNFGDISPNAETTPESYSYYNYDGNDYYTFKFNVSNSAIIGQQITFNLDITDESDNTWSDNFSLTIE